MRTAHTLRSARGAAASVGVVKSALVPDGVLRSAAVRPPVMPLAAAEEARLEGILAALRAQAASRPANHAPPPSARS